MSSVSRPRIDTTMQVKPSEFMACIGAMMNTNPKRALFGWGPPGVAKSDCAMAVATAQGIAFIDVRLSQMDPTDLRGMPYPTIIGGEPGVKWSSPFQLPRDLNIRQVVEVTWKDTTTVKIPNPQGKNGIHYVVAPRFAVKALTPNTVAQIVRETPDEVEVALLRTTDSGALTEEFVTGSFRLTVTGEAKAILALEEFNSAPPSVQAAAYQLVLDRALGEYLVPKAVYILALGNRETDRGITFKMPTPIMNRFVHVEVKADFEDWQVWALGAMVHPDVVGYLTAFKEKLFQFNPGTAARGFPTPRSWHFVSDIIRANSDLPEQIAYNLICGAVGDGVGIEFMEHRRHAAFLPKADDILAGRLKELPKKVDTSLAYALVTTLCYSLKEESDALIAADRTNWMKSAARKTWLKRSDNFLAFMMKNFSPEINVLGATAALATHKLFFDAEEMPNLRRFVSQYEEYICT